MRIHWVLVGSAPWSWYVKYAMQNEEKFVEICVRTTVEIYGKCGTMEMVNSNSLIKQTKLFLLTF
jgi:hypothetical protein